MASPTEIAIAHRALTAAKGDRDAAAQALGKTRADVDELIRSSSELSVLWTRNGADAMPSAAGAYDRDKPAIEVVEAIDLGVSTRDLAKTDAIMGQMTKVDKFDWEGLGEKDAKTLALMRQFEGNGVGRGVLRMMDAMQGGMAFCFMKVSRQLADVAEDLEKEQAKPLDGTGANKRDENRVMFLHARFMDLAKEMQKFNKEATNAAHTRLLIADRAKKIQQAGNRLRKPNWRRVEPTAAAANAGGARG